METSGSVLALPAKTPRREVLLSLASPAAAICYPFLLALFHLSVTRPGGGPAVLSVLLLLSAVAAPFTGVYVYWTLGELPTPSPADVRAKLLALLSVAAPPLYTALGVVLTMLHNPVSDLVSWIVLWVALTAIALTPRRVASPAALASPRRLPRLRYAHGVSAATIVLIFLAMHLVNHLGGLW